MLLLQSISIMLSHLIASLLAAECDSSSFDAMQLSSSFWRLLLNNIFDLYLKIITVLE